jgi:hypothetical protein
MSSGVGIHFQVLVMLFSSKKAVRAMRVMRWMKVMAQPWTEARARGEKMSNPYIAMRGIDESDLVILCRLAKGERLWAKG